MKVFFLLLAMMFAFMTNAMAAGSLGTIPSIDTTDFGAVAIVVLTFAGIAYGVKKALGLIGK